MTIVVKLMGGLGNQMFQYAAGRSLAHRHQTMLKLDRHFLEDRSVGGQFTYRQYMLNIFQVQENFAKRNEFFPSRRRYQRFHIRWYQLKRLFKSSLPVYLKQSTLFFDEKLHHAPSNVYLDGYWQSEKHFQVSEDIIRQEFQFNNSFSENNLSLIEQIKGKPTACLHVRRGDFVQLPVHRVCTLAYYERGIDYLSRHVSGLQIFVFSDDITWCQQNLSNKTPLHFVSTAGRSTEDDLQAMIHCQYFIISNSSFSWWAAWLAPNLDKIVAAPERWVNITVKNDDIVPENWVKLAVT